MVEIDHRVLLAQQPFRLPDVGNALLQRARIEQAQAGTQRQNALSSKAFQEQQQEQQAQAALQEFLRLRDQAPGSQPLMQAAGLETPQASPNALPMTQQPGGTFAAPQPPQFPPLTRPAPDPPAPDPIAIARRKLQALSPEKFKEVIEAETLNLELQTEGIEHIARNMNAATDEESYQKMRPQLLGTMRAIGLPEKNLPTSFAGIPAFQRRSKKHKDIIREAELVLKQATEDRKAREARGKIRNFGLSPTGNAKAAEMFPRQPAGRPLSGGQMQRLNDALAEDKAEFAGSIRAAVVEATAEAQRLNIRLTPIQIDKFVNRSEILGIAEAIRTEFTDREFRGFFGLRNFAERNLRALAGNPRALRLLTLTGRLRSALLFDKEKGGGSALSTNEQAALEVFIPTGREVTAEQFIQKRNLLEETARGQLETNLEISLGTNPSELQRVQRLLQKQRRAIRPGLTRPISASRRRELRAITDSVRGGR